MAVYNGERFIREAVDSILAQTLRDFEFIIVDDGSTDDTAKIISEHPDPRIVLIHHPTNLGLVAALNRGVSQARGKYIARMDADDVALPERLELQVEFLEQNPNVAVLGGGVILIGFARQPVETITYPTQDRQIKETLMESDCFAHPTIIMKKEAFWVTGGYRGIFVHAEDYDLWLRMAERFELANLDAPLLYYRLHDQQITTQNVRQQTISRLAAQATARIRRATGTDPLDEERALDSQTLDRLGIDEESIQKAVIDFNLIRANIMLCAGYEQIGREHLAEVQRLVTQAKFSEAYPRIVGDRILGNAYHYYYHQDYRNALEFLGLCLKINPFLLSAYRTQSLIAKLVLGERLAGVVSNLMHPPIATD